jgi:hypothetical protein
VQQRIFGQSPNILKQKRRCSRYLFGTQVNDPTGWKTTVLMRQPWVKAQNEVTYGYLNQILLVRFKTRLEKLWNYEK